jgi:hypothetical protein
LPSVPISKLFSVSGMFNDAPVSIYVHEGNEALEIRLDEDSVKAVYMVKGMIDELLSKNLILTGVITRKIIPDYTETIVKDNKQIDVSPSIADLESMQEDIESKPLMK